MSNVPKTIFNIWLAWKQPDPPSKYDISREETERLMPDYDYYLVRDEEIKELLNRPQYIQFQDLYYSLPQDIMRADMARYIYLYEYGGIYTDLDLVPTRSLNTVNFRPGVNLIHTANRDNVYTNCFLASSPGEEFWLEVLREIARRYYSGSDCKMERHMAVFYLTGSDVLTTVAKRIPIHTLDKNEIYAYTTCDTYYVAQIEQGKGPYVSTSLYRPLRGMSWVNSYGQILMWLSCHWKLVLYYLIIICILTYAIYVAVRVIRETYT